MISIFCAGYRVCSDATGIVIDVCRVTLVWACPVRKAKRSSCCWPWMKRALRFRRAARAAPITAANRRTFCARWASIRSAHAARCGLRWAGSTPRPKSIVSWTCCRRSWRNCAPSPHTGRFWPKNGGIKNVHRDPAMKRGAGDAKNAKKTFRKTLRSLRLRGRNLFSEERNDHCYENHHGG